jgi:hypothetical protein
MTMDTREEHCVPPLWTDIMTSCHEVSAFRRLTGHLETWEWRRFVLSKGMRRMTTFQALNGQTMASSDRHR